MCLPRKSHEQRSPVVCSPWGHRKVGHDCVTKQQQQRCLYCLLQNKTKQSYNIHIILDLFFFPTIVYYCSVYTNVVEFGNWGGRGRVLWSMTQPVKLSFNEAKKENKTTAKKGAGSLYLSASQS